MVNKIVKSVIILWFLVYSQSVAMNRGSGEWPCSIYRNKIITEMDVIFPIRVIFNHKTMNRLVYIFGYNDPHFTLIYPGRASLTSVELKLI